MSRNLFLPAIAAGFFSLMSYHLIQNLKPRPELEPVAAPARSPFLDAVAAAGVVEPQTENIYVSAIVPGSVAEVAVIEGQRVKAGELLLKLDNRHIIAELKVREAQLAAAQAECDRVFALPRPEDLPPSEARVRNAEAKLTGQLDILGRTEKLFSRSAIGAEELIQKRQAVAVDREALNQAKAEYALLKSGAWARDKAKAKAEVDRAKSMVEQTRIELSRLEVRAPVAGEVLKVDVRPGEYVGVPPGQPLLVIGDLSRLHVRVDVDEQDIPRFRPGLPGKAFVRGDAGSPLPLTFIRLKPFVVPKASLTGSATERVDTRVLQAVFRIEPGKHSIYVGQQLDVYLDVAGVDGPSINSAGVSVPETLASRP